MNDFKVSRAVRLVLTRLRIDTNTVTVRVEQNVLILKGKLQYQYALDGRSPDLNYELLHEMDRQLRRIEDVTKIEYTLENWVHTSDGHWGKKMRRKAKE
jgi:hypothetical protein